MTENSSRLVGMKAAGKAVQLGPWARCRSGKQTAAEDRMGPARLAGAIIATETFSLLELWFCWNC